MQEGEGGWPLGLQPLNARARNHDYSGSISCNTLLSGSPTLTSVSSSDLDTQVCFYICIMYACMYVCIYNCIKSWGTTMNEEEMES